MLQDNFRLPNAIIIGVQKSATTWLAKRISQHPEIFVYPGEVHYFDHEKNYKKGDKWYGSLFQEVTSESVICEKTPDYFWTTCDEVAHEPKDKPSRIYNLIPDVKLIVILRDPVSRAISSWNHNIRFGAISQKISINEIFTSKYDNLITEHGILTRGLYYRQMMQFLKVFKKEQILTLFFEEDIVSNPNIGIFKTFNFLNVDTNFIIQNSEKAENKLSSTQLGVSLNYLVPRSSVRFIQKLDQRLLCKLPIKSWIPEKPNQNTLNRLKEYYEDDLKNLSGYLGHLPNSWTL